MLIKARERDYYDGIMAHGVDRELVYRREPMDGVMPDWPFPVTPNNEGYKLGGTVAIHGHIVGFCGKVYPAVRIFDPNSIVSYDKPQPNEFHYDLEHLEPALLAGMTDKGRQKYESGKLFMLNDKAQPANDRAYWRYFFDTFAAKADALHGVFEESRCPVFVAEEGDHKWEGGYRVRRNVIHFNAILRHYNFGKVKDAYTAYQEVRMWMSNLTSPERPIPKLSDIDLAASKGHSSPYSFRKAPTKHKK